MNPHATLKMFGRKGGSRCVAIGRQIRTYLDSGLDAAAATKASRHLDACRRCGLTADDYRHLKLALAEISAPMPAESLQRLQVLAADLAADLAAGHSSPT